MLSPTGYIGAAPHFRRKNMDWMIAKRRSAEEKIADARERVKAMRVERR